MARGFHHLWLFSYQLTVVSNAFVNANLGFHPRVDLNFDESRLYLTSCPGRSSTKLTRSSFLPRSSRIFLTISMLVSSLPEEML